MKIIVNRCLNYFCVSTPSCRAKVRGMFKLVLFAVFSLQVASVARAQDVQILDSPVANRFVNVTDHNRSMVEYVRFSVEQALNMVDVMVQGYDLPIFLGVDLKKFKTEAMNVNFAYILNATPVAVNVQDGTRRIGALNFRDDGKGYIILTEKSLMDIKSAEVSKALLLHELFMVLGYPDQNYKLSMGIQAMLTMRDPSVSKYFSKRLDQATKFDIPFETSLALAGEPGGATSVGRGGDVNSLKFIQFFVNAHRELLIDQANNSRKKTLWKDISKSTADFAANLLGVHYVVDETEIKTSCDLSQSFYQFDRKAKTVTINYDQLEFVFTHLRQSFAGNESGQLVQVSPELTEQCWTYVSYAYRNLLRELKDEERK